MNNEDRKIVMRELKRISDLREKSGWISYKVPEAEINKYQLELLDFVLRLKGLRMTYMYEPEYNGYDIELDSGNKNYEAIYERVEYEKGSDMWGACCRMCESYVHHGFSEGHCDSGEIFEMMNLPEGVTYENILVSQHFLCPYFKQRKGEMRRCKK